MAGSPRFLHVANGGSTTATIEAAGIPGRCSVWADPLHAGPVPGGLSDAALLEVRARFLADSGERAGDVAADLKQWRAVIADTASYDELVLWFEHDLFDQLNLIQALDFVAHALPAGKRASLICIGSFPGRPVFRGLGELTTTELAPLLDTREPLQASQYELASRAWQAFRDPDPRALEACIAADTSALPFLGPALRRHLEEFPSVRDGLSRTERRLIELAITEPIDLWSAFPQMHEGETAFYIADMSFLDIVQELASASPALVDVDIEPESADHLLHGAVSVTDEGRRVFAGDADRVRLCGLDRWIGGVHLEGRGSMWRWNDDRERIEMS